MGKLHHDDVLDAALNEVATCIKMRVCSAEPTSRANAITLTLAEHTLTGGDFTNANGDTSGRKVTIAAQAGIAVDVSGTGNHISLDDGTTQLLVTTATGVVLTSGGTVDVGAFDDEFLDPT